MKAINIDWDIESEELKNLLPNEIEIPNGMEDENEISDYLSDLTGYCHLGYVLIDESSSPNKIDILKEIKKEAEENLRERDNNISFALPDGKYHIFISVEDIGNILHGEELIYRIEPNIIDETGSAEPMADVYTADFGDLAELLIGCMWCMDQFDADRQQQKVMTSEARLHVLDIDPIKLKKYLQEEMIEGFCGERCP